MIYIQGNDELLEQQSDLSKDDLDIMDWRLIYAICDDADEDYELVTSFSAWTGGRLKRCNSNGLVAYENADEEAIAKSLTDEFLRQFEKIEISKAIEATNE